MSKNIRIDFDHLQPGDKVHLKGSNNVYEFVRKKYEYYPAPCRFAVIAPGIDMIGVDECMFDYATRPAPRRKWFERQEPGEYWALISTGGEKPVWAKLIRRGYTSCELSNTAVKRPWQISHGAGPVYCRPYSWAELCRTVQLHGRVLTSEEYYTRKIKGESGD